MVDDARTDTRLRRDRRRTFLLALLLAALVALLIQRPDLRSEAATFARNMIIDGFDIPPRAIYTLRLRLAGLDDTALGRQWRSAVRQAAAHPVSLGDRYRARDRFTADRVAAHIYATELERGARLDLRLTRTGRDRDSRLFASLERLDDDNDWDTVARLDAGGTAEQVVARSRSMFRIVLQPELGADATYELATARGGSLPFPVQGHSASEIGSGFGAPRDGGSRAHRGVDIFAERGTPVYAVASGRVRTGTQGIGGNHVWLSSGTLGIGGVRYYYAHLNRFAVADGDPVERGDVIGAVGNTGNARTTPPHLHFGIYTTSGPVDPAPYLDPPPVLPTASN